MGRPTTKADLIETANTNYQELNAFILSLTEKELTTPFEFGQEKKEAHWQRDKNLRDILVHLYEWHQLLLHWVRSNQEGKNQSFLPKPYNWKNYGELNVVFWKKHQDTDLEEAKELLRQSHQEVMELAETFSDEELFAKGVFPWVGSSTLGSYFVSNTGSHYNWAIKKLKAHRKNCK